MRIKVLTTIEALEEQRSDFRTRMIEALRKNFEATWLLMGEEEFLELGGLYIKQLTPDLRYCGENFPDFLMVNDVEYEVIQMAKFENAFWKLFHGADTKSVELDQEILENGSFDLSQVELFDSKLRLDLIWQSRQEGVDSLDGVNLAEESYFAIYKSFQKVEVKFLTKGSFSILKDMKKVRRVEGLSLVEVVPNDWINVLEVLKFSLSK